MKHAFSRRIFEKYSNIKSDVNPSTGSRDVPMRTEDNNEVNSCYSQFCLKMVHSAHIAFTFYIYPRTNKQTNTFSLNDTGFYNRDELCLLCGTTGFFK